MNLEKPRKMKKPIGLVAIALFLITVYSFDMPKGWNPIGNTAKSYDMGTAIGEGRDGKNCATIQSKAIRKHPFGGLIQICDAEIYWGKRIKMSGYLKTQDVKKYAGLWLRIDGKDEKYQYKVLGFDNMSSRKINGNTAWTKYEIVLDVPKETFRLVYGALLSGKGKIWFDDITFEIVDESIPITNHYK